MRVQKKLQENTDDIKVGYEGEIWLWDYQDGLKSKKVIFCSDGIRVISVHSEWRSNMFYKGTTWFESRNEAIEFKRNKLLKLVQDFDEEYPLDVKI